MNAYFVSSMLCDVSPAVVSMVILKSSTRRMVTSVYFSMVPSLSTHACFHGFVSLFNFVGMKRMMRIGYHLYAVGKTQRIIVFSQTTVIMEVKFLI